MAGAQLAFGVAQSVINGNAQERHNAAQFDAAVDLARSSALGQYSALQARQMEETARAASAVQGARKQAAAAASTARVSAGEAGVAGVSVDALLGDFERSALDLETSVVRGQAFLGEQIKREGKGIQAQAQGHVFANVPSPQLGPDYLGLALQAFDTGLKYKLAISKTEPIA